MKIYIKIDKRPKNIKHLLEIFFQKENSSTSSIGVQKALNTYSDKECNYLQCNSGRYRSFDDIYLLCQTYFPIVSPQRVLHELQILNLKEGIRMNFSYCHTMGRIRVVPYPCSLYTYQAIISHSEMRQSRWQWKELFSMLNINNQEDLDNYRKKFKIT